MSSVLTEANSQRLGSRIELAMPTLLEVSSEIINHPRVRELFPEFLVRTHWLIRCSAPLMAIAKAECERRADRDPVAAAMIPYLEEHLEEEDGHDELLLQDLELIGVRRQDVLSRMPEPSVATAEGAMYYWTMHHHPVSVFGSLIPSECYPTTLAAIDLLQERTGYPRAAFRTLELHSELDKEHGAEALQFFDSLPLSDFHHEVLGIAALQFLAGTTQMYRDLIDAFETDVQ